MAIPKKLPKFLWPLFHNYVPESINPERDWKFVIHTVMQAGTCDDLAVNDELADLYWDVVERYPGYEFRIEPVPSGCFDESSVPVSAVKYHVGKEGKGRLDIREVAGAWKGHEELRRELEEGLRD